jgi:uncharacterized membrane protein
MISTGGLVAYNSGTSAKLWNNGTSYNLGTGFTAGVAMHGSTVVVAGGTTSSNARYSGVAKRWDGNASGVGSWTNLPQDGGCDWTPMGIGADANDVSIGGSCLWDGVWYGDRYQESKGVTWEGIRPTKPQFLKDYANDSFVYGITASNICAGRAMYGTARSAIGGQNVVGINGLQGFNNLSGAPDNGKHSSALAIAANGSRIVGWSDASGAAQRQAVRWDAAFTNYDVPVAIPLLPGYYWSGATAVSPSGSIIGGLCYSSPGDNLAAWIWDSVHGTRNLAAVLTAAGIDLTGWGSLTSDDGAANGPSLSGISDDGMWFTGTGIRGGVETAWVAQIPEPSSISVLALGLLPLVIRRRKR